MYGVKQPAEVLRSDLDNEVKEVICQSAVGLSTLPGEASHDISNRPAACRARPANSGGPSVIRTRSQFRRSPQYLTIEDD